MSTPIRQDAREQVDRIVQQHAIHYSLVQLRLVGVLLLLMVLSRLLVQVFPSSRSAIELLAGITSLSNWLLLLPIGICLYLLGGGQSRLRHEVAITTLLHRSLVVLALICLLALPVITLQQTAAIHVQKQLQVGTTTVSAYEKELISPARTTVTVSLQVIAGFGLLALQHQGNREIRRHGLTPALFFGSDVVKRRRTQSRPRRMPRPRPPRRAGRRLTLG